MSDQKFTILFNNRAGTVLNMGQDAVNAIIEASDLPVESVKYLDPEEMDSTIESLCASGKPILIAGGDGTILKAVEPILKAKCHVGFIPMGTMNLLAQDLGIPAGLEAALAAYAKGTRTISIDVAELNGHPFLCAAGIGVMPEASKFREEIRNLPDFMLIPRMSLFVFDKLHHMHRRPFRLYSHGRKHKLKTTAIAVSNNRFAQDETGFKKESLRDGLLGIYSAAPRGLWDRVRLLVNLAHGVWSRDPVMRSWQAREATIFSRKSEELVSLDGETLTVKTPLRFKVHHEALSVIVPVEEPAILDAP